MNRQPNLIQLERNKIAFLSPMSNKFRKRPLKRIIMLRHNYSASGTRFVLGLISLLPLMGLAHPFPGNEANLQAALGHPLTSWEHLLTAIAAGFLGRAIADSLNLTWAKLVAAFAGIYCLSHFAMQPMPWPSFLGLMTGFVLLSGVGSFLERVCGIRSMEPLLRRWGTGIALLFLLATW